MRRPLFLAVYQLPSQGGSNGVFKGQPTRLVCQNP
jgi:hypothetical protein